MVFIEESILTSIEVYIKMVAVQIDDVNRSLVSGDILTIIISQESLGDVVD